MGTGRGPELLNWIEKNPTIFGPSMRNSNSVDFWRGVALVMIFINHVPGNVLGDYTMRNFAIADSADLFVFLAGWSMSYATGGPTEPDSASRVIFRLVWRALQLYRAQLVITLLALAILAAAALHLQNPLFLEWNDAGLAFYDPVRGLLGLALLTHQLGYFNILPLYIVLLMMAPALILLARRTELGALALSLALYTTALFTDLTLPSWPSENQWYFNPLSWQLLLLMGFLCAERARTDANFGKLARQLVPVAAVIVGVIAYVTVNGLWPDPLQVPEPRRLFLFDKTYLSPPRIVSLLAVVVAFHRLFIVIEPLIGATGRWLCKLGRNSLPVFAVGSLLTLVGQLARFIAGGSILADLVIIGSGLALSGMTAWFVEWRSTQQSSSRPRS